METKNRDGTGELDFGEALPRPPLELAGSVGDLGFHRRLQTLLRSSPVHRLGDLAGRQGWGGSAYDPRVLALAGVDAVVSRMGFTTELTYDDLVAVLAELARLAEPDVDPGEWATVGAYVVDGLLNDRDDNDATQFVRPYSDYRDGHVRRELRFSLLIERARADGRVVLEASTDAINAFRGGLDLNVDDAQMAAEHVLRAQLERGDLPEAELTAQQKLKLTVELSAEIRSLLDATRMDLSQVDWRAEVLPRLVKARDHVGERTRVEEALLAHLAAGDAAREEDLRRVAARVAATLEECLRRHRELHATLMGATGVFTEEQERQALRRRGRGVGLVNVRERLLLPLLAGQTGVAVEVAATFAEAASGTLTPRLPRLVELVDLLLAPRREPTAPADDSEVSLHEIDDEPEVLDPKVTAAARAVLAGCETNPELLSTMLGRAAVAGPPVAELVRLSCLLSWAPDHPDDAEDDELWSIAADLLDPSVVAVPTGCGFVAGGYAGDDFWVGPAGALLNDDLDDRPAPADADGGSDETPGSYDAPTAVGPG